MRDRAKYEKDHLDCHIIDEKLFKDLKDKLLTRNGLHPYQQEFKYYTQGIDDAFNILQEYLNG